MTPDQTHDITISLTQDQAQALGPEAEAMATWLHSALTAMARLRTGPAGTDLDPADLTQPLTDLHTQLLPRLEGIRDSLIRTHATAGGTVQSLATTLNTPRSSAQYRRETLTKAQPTEWESWATGDTEHDH
ncbi:hypothetical protein [Streptomyces sp. NPDC048659]|uniref:hypothetical protein n=1 Tax=Streptomyces sp. NPDC048659 TaxID=3155489 RepID=UPI003440A339